MNDSLYRIACTLAIINVLLCEGILGELCTKTTSKYTKIDSQQNSYLESSDTRTIGVISGPISNNLYYLAKLVTTTQAVLRKVDLDETTQWISAWSGSPAMKSLAIDSQEQNVYFIISSSNYNVMRLTASTGVIETVIRL